jgi:hypothetical protein
VTSEIAKHYFCPAFLKRPENYNKKTVAFLFSLKENRKKKGK